MTCEVVVLNRFGLSLAADSAVTFSSNHPGGSEAETYSSGVNKIFQLTEREPVGVMVYNAAALQDVPWELILKSFRAKFGSRSCARLADYKKELADYVEQQQELFPPLFREKKLMEQIERSALIFIGELRNTCPVLLDKNQAAAHPAEWNAFFQATASQVTNIPLPHFFAIQDVDDAQAKFETWISQGLNDYAAQQSDIDHLAPYVSTPAVAKLVIEAVFKFYKTVFGGDYTGVVIAGYGNDDFFPGYVEMKYYGFVGGKLVWHEESEEAISHDQASAIEAFATKSMVETFLTGVAPTTWSSAISGFQQQVEQVCNEVLGRLGGSLPKADIDSISQSALQRFQTHWNDARRSGHYAPLVGVVAGLTVEELAELAENLVMLESLKEKVTRRTQSVGGPVDVAVITKAEGLVWLKRKLFFSPELNHRYFARQK